MCDDNGSHWLSVDIHIYACQFLAPLIDNCFCLACEIGMVNGLVNKQIYMIIIRVNEKAHSLKHTQKNLNSQVIKYRH